MDLRRGAGANPSRGQVSQLLRMAQASVGSAVSPSRPGGAGEGPGPGSQEVVVFAQTGMNGSGSEGGINQYLGMFKSTTRRPKYADIPRTRIPRVSPVRGMILVSVVDRVPCILQYCGSWNVVEAGAIVTVIGTLIEACGTSLKYGFKTPLVFTPSPAEILKATKITKDRSQRLGDREISSPAA